MNSNKKLDRSKEKKEKTLLASHVVRKNALGLYLMQHGVVDRRINKHRTHNSSQNQEQNQGFEAK
jgi:hypothetical protein